MPTKLLVVDDEPDFEPLITQGFRRQIREGELSFVFARDGFQALRLLEEHDDVEVLLTDLTMPRMDGLTLLAELQARPETLQTIVVTAYGDMENIRAAMNRGAVDFVTKPIDFSDLAITIKKAQGYAEVRRERQRLLEEKLEADARSKAKSLFLASMSHELRTPLNAIIGYSQLLQELQDEQETQLAADLAKIEAAGRHLLGLISDILDMAKVEAGSMQVSLAPFEVTDMLRDVSATMETLAERNGNRLARDWPDDLGSIRSDLLRVRQCLFNVLSNACKFTQNGEIELSARCAQADDGVWLELAVRDTGIGIEPQELERIFESFTQASGAVDLEFGGAGLGLAITRELCALLGGTIAVESTPGQGSTFTLRFPVDP